MATDQPDSLYKYCSANYACKLLSEQQLRWNSPERFDDPFELTAKSGLNFTDEELLASTVRLISSMIFANDNPKGNSSLITAIRRWRADDRFGSPDEAQDILRQLLTPMVQHRTAQLKTNMEKWAEFAGDLRIACFCSKPDNVIAWQQFGDQHKGAVIRFRVEEEGTFTKPKPVSYRAERPQLTSIREQLGTLLQNSQDPMISRFPELNTMKAPHHKAEQEIRCFLDSAGKTISAGSDQLGAYSDVPFQASEVQAVYFGALFPEKEKKQIQAILQKNYKKIKTFQARIAKEAYSLEMASL